MEIRKSGMISIVGRPNVGKSTLTNALVGEKIAIVTNKPQTTRNRICAVVNREGCQFVFLDTPGLHRARTRLGDYMVKVVKESVADVDAVLLLVEPIPHIGGPEAELIRRIKELNVPAVLVINKIDTVEKEELLSVMQVYGAAHDFAAIVPISAKRNEGVDELLGLLDVLVDGRFVQAEHDISLRFRGSRNQRLLDVPKSLAAGEPIWWQDEQVFSTHTM